MGLNPQSWNDSSGARYGLLFTDDVTRWRRIYFLKEKSDALEKLMLYEGDMSALLNDRNIKIARLHSDNGGEFVGAKFKSYCSGKAILLTTSGPECPEQNGLAERSNRTVVEMARCLRVQSGLGKELWAEACYTAVHILNRVPSRVIDGDTPHHRLLGKHARLDHFKAFGCKAYVQVYDRYRKMDDKAWRGIMIGYDEHNRRC
jgi:transposase InsO family protein